MRLNKITDFKFLDDKIVVSLADKIEIRSLKGNSLLSEINAVWAASHNISKFAPENITIDPERNNIL